MEGRTSLIAALGLSLALAGCTTTSGVKTGPLTIGAGSSSPAPPAEPALPADPVAHAAKKAKEKPRLASAEVEVTLAAIHEEAGMKKKADEPEMAMRILDETRQQYQNVLKMAPDNQKAQEGLVRVYTNMGEHHKARDVLRKALEKTPNDARLWIEVGMTYNRQKNAEEALRCFRKALDLEPENQQYKRVLGYTLVWSGRLNEGMPLLIHSLGAAPAHYNVAGILVRQNRLDEARRHLQLALEVNPDFDRAKDMLTRLREGAPASAPADSSEITPALGFAPLD